MLCVLILPLSCHPSLRQAQRPVVSSLSLPKGTENVIASGSEVEESQNRNADLEKQVNTLVYQLYGVTDAEEIEAVEKR